MISVGDSADTVYSQIGRGILTAATNDPAGQSNIIIFHFYVSEDKTYRISFCKLDKGYYNVCRISLVKLPPKIGIGNQSAWNKISTSNVIGNAIALIIIKAHPKSSLMMI